MASSLTTRSRAIWAGISLVDWAASAVLLLYGALLGLREYYAPIPLSGFLFFLAICAAIYWLVRGWIWARNHLLWSLRNRLVAAYVFIAVVPVLLLLAMAGLAAYLLYWQLGSYVIYTEMEEREERVGVVTTALATSYAAEATLGSSAAALALPVAPDTYIKNAMTELPGLKVETGKGEELLQAHGVFGRARFRGLVFSDGQLALRGVVARQTPSGQILVSVVVPITPEFIDTLAPELGPIQFNVLRPGSGSTNSEVPIVIGTQQYASVEQIGTLGRPVPKAVNPFDKLITGIVGIDVIDQDRKPGQTGSALVFASFSTRPSLLNKRLFSPLGDLGGAAATALLVIGGIFLVIEIGSLITGIVLTRTITTAVNSLYSATQHVQEGDLSYRVRIPHRDQLAALGESFNSMMQSVSTLIEEQRQRQKLENELSIANEVQQQLFPRSLPNLKGIEIEAICRPARAVSGDYYDFIRISPTRLAIALADISGKGISAALLMAAIQSTMRMQLTAGGPGITSNGSPHLSTAMMVSRLNKQLYANTSPEKYATFYFALYDEKTQTLTYTNAGHLPPILLRKGVPELLQVTGTVVGAFPFSRYDEKTVELASGDVLVAYTDGIIEPENEYGEMFGEQRLSDLLAKNADRDSAEIIARVMEAVGQWTGETAELQDDMTILVARRP